MSKPTELYRQQWVGIRPGELLKNIIHQASVQVQFALKR